MEIQSRKKWTSQAIEQLSEEDIVWRPTEESNSIANLVAHIWGTVHSRVEIAYFEIPLTRGPKEREKEFEKVKVMCKDEALKLIQKSFDMIIHVLEEMKSNPEEGLLKQPYINMPPLYHSALKNDSQVLEIMVQMLPFARSYSANRIHCKNEKGSIEMATITLINDGNR